MRDQCVYFTAIACFFLWFALRGLGAFFSPDDMMNLHEYWMQCWSGILRGNLLFVTSAYRPLGGFYYYSSYEIRGLSLTPYRIIAFGLALTNLYPLAPPAESVGQ